MKIRIKLIGVVLSFLLSVPIVAQTKVVDRSARKKPSWLKEQVEEGLKVNVRKATLREAQEKAMCAVKKVMAQVVTQDLMGTCASFTKMYVARLPFIRSASLDKARDIYWQKVMNKKTKEVYIDYYLLYPFSKNDRDRLIDQFSQLNKEMKEQLALLEKKRFAMESVADIDISIRKVEILKTFFFDEVNRKRLARLEVFFKEMYRSIFIEGAFKSPNEYVCQVMLKGRPIAIDRLPRFSSNCASKITLHQEGTEIFVRFSTPNCLAMKENYIDLKFAIKGEKFLHRFYITSENEVALDLLPEGIASLWAEEITADEVKNLTLKFTVNNRNGNDFTLLGADFYVSNLQSPISITQLDAAYHKAGSITFEFKAEGVWRLNRDAGHGVRFIKGAFEVKDRETGRTKRILVNLPYSVNW